MNLPQSAMTCDPQNVAGYLLGGKHPDREALVTLDGTHTYGELTSASACVAGYLLAKGCGKGDRVVLIADNGLFWVASYLGILWAGMVCVPLPPAINPQDLEHILKTTEARFAFLQARLLAKHAENFRACNIVVDKAAPTGDGKPVVISFAQLRNDCLNFADLHSIQKNELAALMFTSGSTGEPRGVMVSHGNIIANTDSIVDYLQLTASDRMMTVLPFHYCFGTSLLHTHLRVGARLVLDQRFMYPEVILQRMIEAECTGFAGVPSHFQILLRNSSLRSRTFPHLRHVQQAGGQLAPVFIRELKETLPNTQVFIMYGQTEATARLSYLPPELLDQKLGSVGKGIPGVKLRVVDESGKPVHPGEVGEIVATGENVTLGYWREPDETASRFRDGGLHTGDLATVDADSFIYIVDRAQDFLKCGGKRVSCRQIENQLQSFECLLEAAVLGIPDEILGEAVQAFVVARMPDCPSFHECFGKFCREHLPPQLAPKTFRIVPSLPKNSSGKVAKRNLRSQLISEAGTVDAEEP